VQVGSVSASAPDLGRSSARARATRGARGAGADAGLIYLAGGSGAAAGRISHRNWPREELCRAGSKLELPGQLKSEITPLLSVLLSVNQQLEWIDGRLEHLAKSDETVARLCTAPSVGPVTAAAFAATIDEAERFKSAHQLEAYIGLTPSEVSSGEKQQKGT
jgi:transposase